MPNVIAVSKRTMAATLLHEARAGIQMAASSLSFTRRLTIPIVYRANCLVLPGFMAPSFAYRDLAFWLRANGLRVRIANFGWLNRPSLQRQIRLLKKEVALFEEEIGPLDIIIGHSLGGIEAVSLLASHHHIKKVIAIASPFNNGTPWRIVEFGARVLADIPQSIQGPMLKSIVRKARPYVSKITTIATIHDKLVPPSHAAFPKAINIVVEDMDEFPLHEEALFRTHTALPNSPFVREHILAKEIAQL